MFTKTEWKCVVINGLIHAVGSFFVGLFFVILVGALSAVAKHFLGNIGYSIYLKLPNSITNRLDFFINNWGQLLAIFFGILMVFTFIYSKLGYSPLYIKENLSIVLGLNAVFSVFILMVWRKYHPY